MKSSKPPKPSSSPPSTLDALKEDADPNFYPPSFEDFAEFKGSAFRESIESLEEMANREPYRGSFGGPSVHPTTTTITTNTTTKLTAAIFPNHSFDEFINE